MSKKPGIFDPWRQMLPPPPEPVVVHDVRDDVLPSEGATGVTPIRFQAGRRAGITVWVPAGEESERGRQAQINLFAAIESLLKDPDLTAIFKKHNVCAQNPGGTTHTKISAEGRAVWAPGSYETGLTAIVHALRDAMRAKDSVAAYLQNLGVRPYVS